MTEQVDGEEIKLQFENCHQMNNPKRPLRRRRLPAAGAGVPADPRDRGLIDAVKRDDVESVERILNCGVDPNLKYMLTTREVENLRFIFESLESLEEPSWSALHEASARAHWRTAQVLLRAGADPRLAAVRQLTPLDVAGATYHQTHRMLPNDLETVTKMLILAGGTFTSMNSGMDGIGTVLHTATILSSVDTVRALLDAGAAVDCRDTQGNTLLHASVLYASKNVLQVLVEDAELLVDMPDGNGRSALQVAVVRGWADGCQLLLDAGADPLYSANNPKAALERSPLWRSLLQSPIYLAVTCDDIEILDMILNRLPDMEALNSLNRDGETLLFTAIKLGHLRSVKMLVYEGASMERVAIGQNALHAAVEYDRIEIMKFLLEFNDDVKDLVNRFNKHGFAPMHSAAMNDNAQCVVLLARSGSDVRLNTAGHSSFTALHIAASYNYTSVAKAILQLDNTTIHEVDERGFTPLHAAIQNCSQKVILLLLNNGATLASTTKHPQEPKTAIELLSNSLPNTAGFLEEVFDSFITSENAFAKTKVTVKYDVLGKIDETVQIKVIEDLVRFGQEKVLIHPVIESFLHIKWRKLLPFFCIFLAIYAFFVLSLNMLVVLVFYYIDRKENPSDFPQVLAWNIMLLISIVSIVLQEYFNVNVKGWRYLVSLESWVRLGAVLLAVVWSGAVWSGCWEQQWLRPAASAALLLAWTELLFLVSRFPNWGYYVLMYGNVCLTIIKILLTFMFLVVAFSLSFMIQFESKPPFNGPWASILKTLVMMTSEFDYGSLFNDGQFETISTSRVVVGSVFLCFLILVSVVLMNFMVGVAVSDISELIVQGNTKRLVKLVETLGALEVAVHGGALRWLLPMRWYQDVTNKRFIHNISTFPGIEKTWSVSCGDKTQEDRCGFDYKISLPKTLCDAIIKRANRRKTRQEDQKCNKAYSSDEIDAYETITNHQLFRQLTVKHLSDKLEKMATEIKETKQMQLELVKKTDKILGIS